MPAHRWFQRHRWLFIVTALVLASVLLFAAPVWKKWSGSQVGEAPADVGVWNAPVDIGVIGIHAALLTSGKVLLYYYPLSPEEHSPAKLFDPANNQVTDVTPPIERDIYCSGVSNLPDGRFLAIGGQATSKPGPGAGTKYTTIFDPNTETWLDGPEMSYARWYPTSLQLPDGKTLAVGGIGEDAVTLQRTLETYDPVAGTWTSLPASANLPAGNGLYPRLDLLSDGTVVRAGTDRDTYRFNPNTNTWTLVATMNWGTRLRGGVVLLPGLTKILTSGGSMTARADATATAEIIDFAASTPKWQTIAPMNHPRKNHNLILLPDGTVLAVGGGRTDKYALPVKQAELYDPTSGSWKLLATQQAQRTYHSTALLLPDGRVLSAGSDNGPMASTVEIYQPPYLFRGLRPTITSNSSSITYKFVVSTPDANRISKVALLKLGTTTHANNTEQRYVELTFSTGSGELTVRGPASAKHAPPGYYMLVIVDTQGVPSVMPIVKVG